MHSLLLIFVPGLPLLMLLACAFPGTWKRVASLLWLAPLPAILVAFFLPEGASVRLTGSPYEIHFLLDGPGRVLLLASSLLWLLSGIYVPTFFREKKLRASFVVCWLLTLTGSLGIFLVADVAGFLIFYALVSLPAYGLVIFDGSSSSRRAGNFYMTFAILGENLLLLALMGLVAVSPHGSLRISDLVEALMLSDDRGIFFLLFILGFGMKMALLPMHFWMPLSYRSAPVPAAAVMSGAAVKAGVIGLLRFLPFGTPLFFWGELLVVGGFCGAFYGVAVGLTQRHPKTILAYSSISQMGFLAAVMGMGLAAGDASVTGIVAFYAAHHVLVKGALFLAVGVAGVASLRRWGMVYIPGLLIGLGLAGLPFTGGALAKLVVKDPLGYGWAASFAVLASAGTALLMLHFLDRLKASVDPHAGAQKIPMGMMIPWLGTALLCVLLPWMFYSRSGLGVLGDILEPATLWKTLWPVGLGVGLFLVFHGRIKNSLHIPEGDIAGFAERIFQRCSSFLQTAQQIDKWMRLWPVACLFLLVIGTILTMLLMRVGS